MTDALEQPCLSVVIPTLGRPILIQTLEALINADGFEQLQVIIVGRLPDPELAQKVHEMIAAYPSLSHLDVAYSRGDSSEKKNAGWHAARSDIVAFLDDDVVVAPDWPLRMREAFNDPVVALVSGPGLTPPDAGRFARLAGLALASPAAGYVAWRYRKGSAELIPIKWSKIIGCNMAYRRAVLESIGGFDRDFWPGEEMIAAYKAQCAGHELYFYSPAFCYHYPRHTLSGFWKQMFGYGATRIRLIRAGVEFEPMTLVPALWVGAVAILLLASIVFPGFLKILGILVASYTILAILVTVSMVRETRRLGDLLLLFVLPLMHISYGMAGWWELLHPNRDFSVKS